MRKAIAIFFLLLFSASFTEAGQLLRLPLLVKHYATHRSNDNTLTLAAFIQQHYLEGHHSDGDEQQDNQLPFKTYTVNTSAAPFLLAAAPVLLQPAAGPATPLGMPQMPFVFSSHLFGIFHPPRWV